MSILKRAWLYVSRKKSKSILMFFILFGIATATISGVTIQKATNFTRKSINQSIGAYFAVMPTPGTDAVIGTRGMGAIPSEAIEQVKQLKGILKYDIKAFGEADLVGLSKVKLENPRAEFDPETQEQYKNFVDLSGNKNSANDTKFTSGTLQRTAGRHINEKDVHKVLVHEDFAQLNHLQVGDKITLKPAKMSSIQEYATEPKPEKIEVEIIGLFSGSNQQTATLETELIENLLISDLETVKEINGFSDKSMVYQEAKFFAESPKAVNELIKQVKALPYDFSKYQLIASNDDLIGLTGSLDSMDYLIKNMIRGTLLVSIVILSLILAFWMNGRVHETGVLLAMGKSKINIISQYFIELLMIAVFSFSCSYFSGNLIAQKIGDQLIQQANQNSKSMINQGLGGLSLGADPETSLISKTVDAITVQITPSEMFTVFVFGILIILVSVCLSSYFIVRLKPKEILSKMS